MSEKDMYYGVLGVSMAVFAGNLAATDAETRNQPNQLPAHEFSVEMSQRAPEIPLGAGRIAVIGSTIADLERFQVVESIPTKPEVPFSELGAQADALAINMALESLPKPEPDLSFLNLKPQPVTEVPSWRQAIREQANSALPPKGDIYAWMTEAGVTNPDIAYTIFTRESGRRPNAINPGDCIGLGQNCPDKNGNYWLVLACPDWANDPVCQIGRLQDYVLGKYGSWEAALDYWDKHHSY